MTDLNEEETVAPRFARYLDVMGYSNKDFLTKVNP